MYVHRSRFNKGLCQHKLSFVNGKAWPVIFAADLATYVNVGVSISNFCKATLSVYCLNLPSFFIHYCYFGF